MDGFSTTAHSLWFGNAADPQFEEYVQLRDHIYARELGFRAPRDRFDELSRVLYISNSDGSLAGGARLIPRTSLGLALEYNGFALSDHLAAEFIASRSCFEVSRIAIIPQFRSFKLSVEVFRAMQEEVERYPSPCILTIAPFRLAQMTRRFTHEIDRKCIVIRNLALGELSSYRHLREMCMCVITQDKISPLVAASPAIASGSKLLGNGVYCGQSD
jgi:hypothetical protein